MSTRCNIVCLDMTEENKPFESLVKNTAMITYKEVMRIEEIAIFYIHCDGYPEGVGRRLLDLFCQDEVKKASQALRAYNISKKLYASSERYLQEDIEYLYIVAQTKIYFYSSKHNFKTDLKYELIGTFEISELGNK
ncbi:MAG: hypothetical protein FWG98_06980 [Candidatus Cloacimonetes bacterium]|nr:hypothetical protein [Candidatus Cloacimonadota bacterium]